MAVTVSYPGVYIEEFTPGPPIQGVGTSTAAFLGPAPSGPILEPTLVTSWDQFKQIYGSQPLPGYYLWYAVQGFFMNGGQLAYIVRISNAAAASFNLLDRGATAHPTVNVQAQAPDAAGNSIQVTVTETQALNHLAAFTHTASIFSVSGTAITFNTGDDAIQFRPGDEVIVVGDPTHRASVLTINQKTVTLSQTLPTAAAGQTLAIPDLEAAQDTIVRFRVGAPDDPTRLTAGTYLVMTDGTNTETAVVKSVQVETIMLSTSPPPLITYRVTLTQPVVNNYALATLTATSREFDLQVTDGSQVENYHFLSVEPVSPHYYALQVNQLSQLVTLSPAAPPPPEAPYENLPQNQSSNLAGGLDESLPGLLPSDYQNGLDALVSLDVNLVAIPDRQDVAVQTAVLDHCQGTASRIGNRFAILDSLPGAPITGPGSVADQVETVQSFNGFAALYYPWILVPPAPPPPGSPPPPVAPPNLLIPPSGHMAGVYARIDNTRGVHKAPAGLEAVLQGAIGVERVLGDIDQGLLNITYGVDVIRTFKGGPPTAWGARTTAVVAGNTNWQYVNIRRLFLFLEASISEGIRFAVFEPNNLELWGKLNRSITAFLTKVWQDGALFGATAKEAFYVRIDDALNPPDQMALGYLTIEIGVRPAYPAEFIVVRIGIWQGGTSITET